MRRAMRMGGRPMSCSSVGSTAANPDSYSILYSGAETSAAGRERFAMLESLLARVAEAGRLRMNVTDAAHLIHAGGMGVVFSPMATPDPRLSETSAHFHCGGHTRH